MNTFFARKSIPSQRGINMVDLMMWLVIAALLLAAALQGIGFYQHRAFIEQMSNDASNAGSMVLASSSTQAGVVTTAVLQEALDNTNRSGDVVLRADLVGKTDFTVTATHPAVSDYRVVFSSADVTAGAIKTGVNILPLKNGFPTGILDGGKPIAGQCSEGQWKAEYWPSYQISGDPLQTRCETGGSRFVNFYGDGYGGPGLAGIGVDNFSARWTKEFDANKSEDYSFYAMGDDGVRVYLDGNLILDAWTGTTPRKGGTVIKPVSQGRHTMTVEFHEGLITAYAAMEYKPVAP